MGEDADPVSALVDPVWWRSVFSLSGLWRKRGHGASCCDPFCWYWVRPSSCLLYIQLMLLSSQIRDFLGKCMGPYSLYPRLPGGAAGNLGEIVSFGLQSTVGLL